MADKENIYPKNVPGRFFVDMTCIDCNICHEIAPQNFKRSEEDQYYFVFKQPTTTEEELQCKDARDACPMECIGELNT